MRSIATTILIASIALFTPSCVGSSIHGLEAAQWMDILARGEPLPIKAGDAIDFEAIGRLGQGALLFVGMAAQDRGDEMLAATLFREAARVETGRYRERAAALSADALVKSGDGAGMLELSASESGAALPAYRRAYLEALGLSLEGSHAKAVAAIEALRSAYPADAARDAVGLASLSLSSGFLAGRGRWTDDFASLVGIEGSPAVYKALADAVAMIAASGEDSAASAIRAIGSAAFQLAEARAQAGSRDFGPALVSFRRHALDVETPEQAAARIMPPAASPALNEASSAPNAAGTTASASKPPSPFVPLHPETIATLMRSLSRPAASDAARAFLAASRDEGAACFSYLVDEVHDWSVYPSRKYFEAFWHGRFLREAERWKAAESAFGLAITAAVTSSERDAAAWYLVECAWKRAATDTTEILGKALAATRNPGYFSDLIEPLSREALVARDGAALATLDATLAGRLSARDAARMAYLCGRAAQVGIISEQDVRKAFGVEFSGASDYAQARFRTAWDQRADSWYRLAAAYRLGEALVDPLESDPAPEPEPTAAPADEPADEPVAEPADEKASTQPPAPATIGPDEYALQLARFGLGARIRTELGAEFNALSWDTVRSAASTLSVGGRYDQSYRLIATLFWKTAFKPTRVDAELYWPRPYREAFIAASAATGIDECLLFGLARSESAFDPAAVSKSGAIGLTQLMPATAAEMAGRLKLSDWSLTDPEDNLAIGSAYFARVLDGVDSRILPAVFSYNGGPTRFKRWEAEYGSLPPDLLLEALSYAETRQYGRNVATAALSYAALYGEFDLHAYFAWLIGEAPHP